MFKLILIPGTRAFIGTMPVEFLREVEVALPSVADGDYDAAAETLCAASQGLYGLHLPFLAHSETVRRVFEGVEFDVLVNVTYGAHATRNETEVSRTPVVPKVVEPLQSPNPSVPFEMDAQTLATARLPEEAGPQTHVGAQASIADGVAGGPADVGAVPTELPNPAAATLRKIDDADALGETNNGPV